MAKNTKKVSKKAKKPAKKIASKKSVVKSVPKSNAPLIPLFDRVLVRELGEEEMFKASASGIILPDSASKDEGGKRGVVIAVGEGRVDSGVKIPVSVKVGQTILYSWGDKIKVSGEEYIIVRESEIIAILNS